jgi:1,4-alpha-glucan branching enzyme
MSATELPMLKCTEFHIRAKPGSDVYVSGSFNHWNGKAKKMINQQGTDDYYITLMLPPGKYEYKFVVDGDYKIDSDCPNWVLNDYGSLNSLITVE